MEKPEKLTAEHEVVRQILVIFELSKELWYPYYQATHEKWMVSFLLFFLYTYIVINNLF